MANLERHTFFESFQPQPSDNIKPTDDALLIMIYSYK